MMSEANIDGNTGGVSPAREEPNHLRRAIILWLVLSVIGIVLVIVVSQFILPPAANDLGNSDNFSLTLLTVLAVPVSMFVFVFLLYSLFVFRVKDKPTEDAIPLKPRPSLQIGWMGITGALCLFLVIYGLFAFYQESSAASTNTLVVKVTAQQWQWSFEYPQSGATSAGAQLIELPVNRPVQFFVTSDDVLHGFAIRALGVRVDANPGEVTTTTIVTPTVIGSYAVQCVELCGLFHSYMWEQVKVVSAADFNSWITSQGGHP
jgi:cytochrome c oxidase subunit II